MNKIFLSLLLFILPSSGHTIANLTAEPIEGIWHAENEWNEEYEEEYGRWLNTVAPDQEFFSRLNIGIDCADVTYGFRWIFSRIHRLPAMATSVEGGVITHESLNPAWAELPTAPEWYNDQRFLKALDFLLRKTWTVTLANDSYPVEISQRGLSSGTFFLNLDGAKHVDVIYKTEWNNKEAVPFQFVSSSVPRAVKRTKFLVFWYEAQPKTENEGFRRFLWPRKINDEWSYVPAEEMPYYSKEQYDSRWSKENFWGQVYYTVKPNYSRRALAQLSIEELVKYLAERQETVVDGYRACGGRWVDCHPKSKAYDEWSTPSRDKRVQRHIDATRRAVGWNWAYRFNDTPALNIEGKKLNLYDVHKIWRNKRYNSDPREPVRRRWGIY